MARWRGPEGSNAFAIEQLPFRVGRRSSLDLTLSTPSVSGDHAEIYINERTDKLHVRDLKSANGTFVNYKRICDEVLDEGDILHFAEVEFRLRREMPTTSDAELGRQNKTLQLETKFELSDDFLGGVPELMLLMREQLIVPNFQPIVELPSRKIEGYEVLTRGQHPKLPESPLELLRIASLIGLGAELSRMFRNKALEAVEGHSDLPILFLNTHPEELKEDPTGLVEELRKRAPRQALVLEIHERTLADPDSIRELRAKLSEHCIGLAFDDFGAGEARLVQLAEVPPDYLKFDKTFVQGIDTSAPAKRHVLRSIVGAANDIGVRTVAEGIETEAEAEVCSKIGFTHAQGYLFGRPLPLDKL